MGFQNLRQSCRKINLTDGTLKRLDERPEIDFLRPCGTGLTQASNHCVSNRARRDDGFARAIGLPGAEFGSVDLAVDNHMHDMNSLGMELTGQGLAKHSKPGFADRQRREAGAAPERRRSSGK